MLDSDGIFDGIKAQFDRAVMPTYSRFNIAFERGKGSALWDTGGKRYLDFAAGVAVCSLGHAHPELAEALNDQALRLWHVSNLFYHAPQGHLAAAVAERMMRSSKALRAESPGKVFFCNSGAEANEALYKLARKFGAGRGRFEVLTALGSFHGRTLAGISATGQEKVKLGFEPMVEGFRSVPFNDLEAMEAAVTERTAAILVEGVQGEGGILPASPDYLLGLRRICDKRGLLLLMDSVQCGMYRTGAFQSYERILEGAPGGEMFAPDAVSFAKGLGGGFPIGAIWARVPFADVLGPGSHAATFGGNLLACTVASKILDIIDRDSIGAHVRRTGGKLRSELERLTRDLPEKFREVRGLGFMLGLELVPDSFAGEEGATAAARFVNRLLREGLIVIPAGANVVRFVPPLTTSESEVAEAIAILSRAARI